MSAKIDCLEGMECDVCHSTAIGVNADNEFVCLECSIVQSDPNFGMESRLKVQRTEILHAGDIGSLIGPIKGTVLNTRMRQLTHLQKETITPIGRSSLEATHLFIDLQDQFHLPLTVDQLTQEFRRYYPKILPRSKARNVPLFSTALYLQFTKQIQTPLSLRQVAANTSLKIADLFHIQCPLGTLAQTCGGG